MTSPESNLCKVCVLPKGFPNISFNPEGVCNFCTRFQAIDRKEFLEGQKADFDRVVQTQRGQYSYDAICCYSGGKDSTYMLKMMVKDFGLRVLAYTLDNGFIADQAKTNIRTVVDLLGVDHIFYAPSSAFMKKMYRASMLGTFNAQRGNYKTRISDACLSCISLVNTYAAKLALQNKVPMIFSGFTPGQIPKAVIKDSHRFYKETYDQHKAHFDSVLGQDTAPYLDLKEPYFETYQMSPYLVYNIPESKMLSEITAMGWKHPENLDGCSSNCSLNAVGNKCHEKRYGFHPYALELSQLVRQGLLTRGEAIQKLEQNVDPKTFSSIMSKLGISNEELERLGPTTDQALTTP